MSEEFITIARFESAAEAHEARAALEDAEIEAVVTEDAGIAVFPSVIGLGSVQLLVPRDEAQRAIQLLEHTPAEDDLEAEETGDSA